MTMAVHAQGEETRLREDVCRMAASLFERGLTAGSSGNISVRLGDGWLVTPTNATLGRLSPERLSKLDGDGRHVSGGEPSKEAVLHRAMYAARPRARAVVHLHSTYSAAVSCMAGLDCENCIPPLTAYFVMKIGRLPLLPYFRPGDPRAAKRSVDTLAGTAPCAMNAIEELEETAKLFLLLRGTPTRPLDGAEISELEDAFGPAVPNG